MKPSAQPYEDQYFLRYAANCARLSRDPATQVGAVIVGLNGKPLSSGYNRFPVGITESPERLSDRDLKLRLMVHAEMNAVLSAAQCGISLKGATIYFAATDDTGCFWGGAPCTRCTVELIQAGIAGIVTLPMKTVPSRWHDDLAFARQILDEAGINYREAPGIIGLTPHRTR